MHAFVNIVLPVKQNGYSYFFLIAIVCFMVKWGVGCFFKLKFETIGYGFILIILIVLIVYIYRTSQIYWSYVCFMF